MAWKQLANNAKTTLDADCTDVATTISPTAKTTFPDPEDDGSFYATIWDADTYPDPGDDPGMEIVLVTADAAANWTVTRGQAGTAGAEHVAGDAVRLLWLAEHAQEIQDAVDLNSTHRTNVDAVAGIVLGDGAGGYTAAAATDLPAHATEHESGGGDEVDHNALQNTHNLTTDIDHNALLNTHNLTTDIDHNALTNYDADRHYLQADIEAVDTDLATGLLKVTTGTGALSSITDSSANWDAAYSHVSASGASHSYLDQAVTIAGTPQFAKLGLGAAAGDAVLTLAEATTAAGGIAFGADVDLYRSAANVLSTDDSLSVALGAVINEGGGDYDTRIEGDTDVNLIYVDAGNDRVGIGTATPPAKLSLAEGTTAAAGIALGTDVNLYRSAADVLTLADKLEMGSNIDLGKYALFFGTADDVKLQYTYHANTSILNQYSPGGALVNSRQAIRCVEGVGNTVVFGAATGSTEWLSSANQLGRITYTITQADPSALKAKIDFYVNTGDDAQIAMTINDDKSALFAAAITAPQLTLTSTTAAFLPPRMTTTQRDAIASPAAGMVIYNITTNVLNFYNGSAWGAV